MYIPNNSGYGDVFGKRTCYFAEMVVVKVVVEKAKHDLPFCGMFTPVNQGLLDVRLPYVFHKLAHCAFHLNNETKGARRR